MSTGAIFHDLNTRRCDMGRNQFPLTATDEVEPTHPKDEPTREEVNRTAVTPEAFMQRTRRYFRFTRKAPKLCYARGLDSKPEDFA